MTQKHTQIRSVNKFSPELNSAWDATYLLPTSRPSCGIPLISPPNKNMFGNLKGEMIGAARQWYSLTTRWKKTCEGFKGYTKDKIDNILMCKTSEVRLNRQPGFPCKHKMCPSCHFRRTFKLAQYLNRDNFEGADLQFSVMKLWSQPIPLSEASNPKTHQYIREHLKLIWQNYSRPLKGVVDEATGQLVTQVGYWIYPFPVHQQPAMYLEDGYIQDKQREWRWMVSLRVLLMSRLPLEIPDNYFPVPARQENFGKEMFSALTCFMEYPHTWYIGKRGVLIDLEEGSRGLHDLKLSLVKE